MFNVIMTSVFANQHLTKLGSYLLSYRQLVYMIVLSSSMVTFQRDASQVLEKLIPGCKIVKSLG